MLHGQCWMILSWRSGGTLRPWRPLSPEHPGGEDRDAPALERGSPGGSPVTCSHFVPLPTLKYLCPKSTLKFKGS